MIAEAYQFINRTTLALWATNGEAFGCAVGTVGT
jgi:hypothetical protein